MSRTVLCYTRKPINNILYDPRLAYSMHLAIRREDGSYEDMNHNSGVLFALGIEDADGAILPKSMEKPHIFGMKDGGFGILSIRIEGDGGEDESSKGCVLFCTTKDFVRYEEVGLIGLDDTFVTEVLCEYAAPEDIYRIRWQNDRNEWKQAEVSELKSYAKEQKGGDAGEHAGLGTIPKAESEKMMPVIMESKDAEALGQKIADVREALAGVIGDSIEGCVPCHTIEVDDSVADYMRKKLQTPVNTGIEFPKEVSVSGKEEFLALRAKAFYSDGTVEEKRVDWNLSGAEFTPGSSMRLSGRIHRKHFPFPVAFNRADPCVCRWEGKYYFIATNDADQNHTLYIRTADTLEGLVDAEEILLLDSSTYEGIGGLLWAPEFHEIEGRLYIFHAATPGPFFYEESHIMSLREGGNPACREDWSAPRRIERMDGGELCPAGKTITLDMTCFFWEGEYYVVWSQREFLPKDLGAWLYIAKLNKEEPWRLATEPVVLSKPDYGWANNHTFVDEGPFALLREDKLYLTYSSAAVDTSYVVSYLEIAPGKDLLEAGNWRKNNYPILTSRSVKGEFGTGHNAYVIDEEGTVWNTYHARPGTEGVRSSGIRRVHFDAEGCPRLDVTEELDVLEEYLDIETTVTVLG